MNNTDNFDNTETLTEFGWRRASAGRGGSYIRFPGSGEGTLLPTWLVDAPAIRIVAVGHTLPVRVIIPTPPPRPRTNAGRREFIMERGFVIRSLIDNAVNTTFVDIADRQYVNLINCHYFEISNCARIYLLNLLHS